MTAVIPCGCSGVGKTALLDILAEHKGPFVHNDTAASVTSEIARHDITYRGHELLLVDVPGTSDPDSSNEEKNHQLLVHTLSERKCQVFLFVIAPETAGGRVTSSDVEAFKRLQTCFGVESPSILGIVNRNSNSDPQYLKELESVLQENKIQASSWIYVPELDLSLDSKNEKFSDSRVATVRDLVLEEILKLESAQHQVIGERETAERLLKEMEELKLKEKAELEEQLQREAEEQRLLNEKKVAAELKLKEEEKKREQEEAERKRQAEAFKNAELARQAELKRRQDAADALIRPVKCDETAGNGNPCQRYTHKYTVGYVKKHGVPHWNCKWEGNQHHSPRVKGI